MSAQPWPGPGEAHPPQGSTGDGSGAQAPAGPLEPPIRAPLFGPARFEQHGRSLARAHVIDDDPGRGALFFPRLQDNVAVLQQARRQLDKRARDGRHLGPAAHWLLDNAPLIDEQLHAVRHGLPRNFFRLLPRLRDEPLAGLPRIYGVAWAWVAHTDSGLSTELLATYLRAYQSERELLLAELWALPTTLRVVLLENLRRLAERLVTQQAAREAAHHWFDHEAEAANNPETFERALAQLDAQARRMAERGVGEAFLLQLDQRQEELPPEQCQALDAWLAARLPDPAGALARQQNEATEDQQSIRNAITSLRALERLDWRALIAAISPVIQQLQRSPIHAAEAPITQDQTLHAVERLARRSGRSESTVAQLIVELTQSAPASAAGPSASAAQASHAAAPAYWWRGAGRARLHTALGLAPPLWSADSLGLGRRGLLRAVITTGYLGGLAALTVAAVLWLLRHEAAPDTSPWLLGLAGLLLLGPVSEAVVALVNRCISESVRPRRLPRLAFDQGLPPEQQTLVVMPVMLDRAAHIAELAGRLERHHLANTETHTQFALLTDYLDAPAEQQDGDAALLNAAREAIEALNQRHRPAPGQPLRFLLLHRERRWSDSEQCWMGWERKRGKLMQLVRALVEPDARPFVALGALSQPAANTRYLLTLDADTELPPGRLRALVGIAAHPLNEPRLDPLNRRVIAGHAILQPRILSPLPTPSQRTPFHWLFSGEGGIDPYSAASSEIYQDLFSEGTFTGKGLLHVGAIHATLSQRLPEGQVLSHDLLEGAIARCAAVNDVTLVEESPVDAEVAASRLSRWTRGDWQLLPFLARPGTYPMAAISRWKMLDNLRRSLVAPLSLALLMLVLISGVLPLGWTLLVVAAAFGSGPLLGAVAGLAPSRDDVALTFFYRQAGADLLRAAALPVWHIQQLLQQSLMYGGAIVRALHRQWRSHRLLLQWTTAAAAQAASRTDLPGRWRQLRAVPVAAAVLLALLVLAALLGAPVAWGAAVPLLALWALGPVASWWVSRPHLRQQAQEALDTDARQYLRSLARDTWRYYEQHITAADHHLPPDNVQQTPYVMVAHRSSPTNFGLYLLAVACARELGFIGLASMVQRLQDNLDTLEALPRWHGHFYNWMDTQTLAVLAPAYVSTVDSGNCSAHLLATAQACEQAAALSDEQLDATLRQALHHAQLRVKALLPVLASTPASEGLATLAEQPLDWPPTEAQRELLVVRLQRGRSELDLLHLGLGDGFATSATTPATAPTQERSSMWLVHDLLATLESALMDHPDARPRQREQLRALARRCRLLALAPDYRPLYDAERKLLHIGYRVEAQQLDDNHYDLLASEARLTSLVGIAKGDLPAEHWGALGRPFFARGAMLGLKSWSGSMFEYLMPSLVLDEPRASVLGQVLQSAVAEQRQDGAEHGTPWGISESAIAGQDHTLAYQYGPQGAARLALKRMAGDERVVAPYATVLAAQVDACAAVTNLRALQELGARRALGFVEALDYTPSRQSAGSAYTLVHTYMTHHQSMSLVALANLLADNAPRRWAMGDAHLQAVATLLHERPPREVHELARQTPEPPPRGPRSARLVREVEPLQQRLPDTQLLTNGRYAVLLRSHGAGHSSWDGVGLSRWRDDLLRDAHGSFLYLQRVGAGGGTDAPWQSLTAHPAPDPQARYRCRIQADRVIYDAHWNDLQARCAVWVSPEDDCELRQLELLNTGDMPLGLRLAAVFEATLAPQRGDEAHPAFSNLFIQARWDASEQALHLHRRPRLPDEPAMRAVHFLAAADGPLEEVQPVADRARWLGRHGSSARPLGDAGHSLVELTTESAEPGVAVDTGLDPLAGLVLRLTLPPGASIKLTFCTAAGREGEALAALVDKYRQPAHVDRAASMSHTMAGIRLRELQFDADTWAAVLRLNTLLSAQATRDSAALWRAPGGAAPRCDRRLLWRHGISGDRPLVWVSISGEEGLALVQTLKKALLLWTSAGLGVDLVVSNGEPPSYLSPVHSQLMQMQTRHQALQPERPAPLRSAMHLLREQDLSADERFTLHTLARLRLVADGRPLTQQLERWVEEQQRAHGLRDDATALAVPEPLTQRPRGTPLPPPGDFDAQDGRYRFELSPGHRPSRPWVNVLANPQFGCQVSELAGGYTWAGNSRMHQVTGWSNDPLSDPPGEWLLLQDLDRQQVWPLGRQLLANAPVQVEHGLGFSRITQTLDGIAITLTWCVDRDQSVKQVDIALSQASGPRRRLRLVAMAEWQMGSARQERLSLLTRPQALPLGPEGAGLPRPGQAMALQATQLDHLGGFGLATATLALRPAQPGDAWLQALDPEAAALAAQRVRLLPQDWTCDRREFFDARGQLQLPQRLGQHSGTGLDACAALAAQIELAGVDAKDAPAEARLTLLLGHADSPPQAQALMEQAWRQDPALRLEQQQAQWPERFGGVQVRTPDPRFDALINHWLPYQTLVCRMWARAGFYQAGGAFGYRDQLQDAMALADRDPALLAQQIRRNAARQFPEGDVQHWWHEPGGAGVRTHFSDDRLWLPYALAHYLQRGGDAALLDEALPFLRGQPVPEGAEDIYETPQPDGEPASLYEHAARAIDRSLAVGQHGLPLFGTGDWNDGMNRVGHEGRGESVWLAWFLCQVIEDFLPVAERRGDQARAHLWQNARQGFVSALEGWAWDGRWYLRGFFDNGTPLGSASRDECRIDLIAQAWAVLTGAADPERARQAMASAQAQLMQPGPQLVALLDPPLAHSRPSAGYIQAYPPGVRENGGQYNHGAVWALMAFAKLGQQDAAWQAFTSLSPAHRWMEPRRGAAYALEPYVMAGDIYTQPPWVGRGGWSWYTGSAGWLLRAGLESLCGVVRLGDVIRVQPCLPPHWSRAEVSLVHQGRTYRVVVCGSEAAARATQEAEPALRSAQVGEDIALADAPSGTGWLVRT